MTKTPALFEDTQPLLVSNFDAVGPDLMHERRAFATNLGLVKKGVNDAASLIKNIGADLYQTDHFRRQIQHFAPENGDVAIGIWSRLAGRLRTEWNNPVQALAIEFCQPPTELVGHFVC